MIQGLSFSPSLPCFHLNKALYGERASDCREQGIRLVKTSKFLKKHISKTVCNYSFYYNQGYEFNVFMFFYYIV